MTTLTKTTKSITAKSIVRNWHLLDASGQILGRISSNISSLLQGKHKSSYVPNIDSGDYVVVINASGVRVSGSKESNKIYDTYSGHPGGRKEISFEDLLKKDPEKVFRFALKGMLPKNKLRDPRLARLHIFNGSEHSFGSKFSDKK